MRRLAILSRAWASVLRGAPRGGSPLVRSVFDGEKAVTLTGEVASVEWTNPHFHFSIDVKDADGAVTRWRFEGYPPNMLVRQGWQRDETLMPGATVTVEGWAARSEPNSGAVRWVTLADGRKLAAGPPAGTGGR